MSGDAGPVQTLLDGVLPESRVHCLTQVHGNRVADAADWAPGALPEADAIVSCNPADILCIRTADCLPILAWSADPYVVAGIHGGWRSLAGGIVEHTLKVMRDHGARGIRMSLGPAIGACCFEVGGEVAAQFGAPAPDGKAFLDLWRIAARRACAAGIPAHDIRTLRLCTRCRGELFHSWRRDGEDAGRNLSLIGGGSWSLPGLRAA